MIRKAKAVWRGSGEPAELRIEAAVSLDQEGSGFGTTRSARTLRGQVPYLADAAFAEVAKEGELNCPLSKVLMH
jgi:osmotically inducible protein OsmC